MSIEQIEERVKKQANHYIDRILVEIAHFASHNSTNKPTIIMSRDVFNILQAGSERLLYVNYEYHTICGCKVDVISGTKKLYVGLNLLE